MMKMQGYCILTIVLLLGLLSCDLDDPTEGLITEEVVQLIDLEGVTLPADGNSRLDIGVQLGAEADANQTVQLRTEAGRLQGADINSPQELDLVIPGKSTSVTLVSDTEVREEVVVSATLNGFVAQYPVTFTRAFPDNMIVTADRQLVQADRLDFAEMTISLSRDDNGLPSNRAKVFLETLPLDTATAQVEPFVFTSGQTATARVRSGNGLPGQVELWVRTQGSSEELMEKVLLVFE